MEEYEKLKRLKSSTHNKLMEKLTEYIFKHFSLYPTSETLTSISSAVAEIFDLSGGSVCIFLFNNNFGK